MKIGNLTALAALSLSDNQLTEGPEAIGNLTALTALSMWGNQLKVLPEVIGNLTALTLLDLSGNQLTGVPEAIGKLTTLTELGLSGHPISEPIGSGRARCSRTRASRSSRAYSETAPCATRFTPQGITALYTPNGVTDEALIGPTCNINGSTRDMSHSFKTRLEKRRPDPEGLGRRFRRSTAVAVGSEPTVDFHPHTLSSSANQRSATFAGVRRVLNQAVCGGQRTRADDDE